jgi:hypothetical protein
MIALASDCLLFQMAGGESVPFSAEMISCELMGGSSELFDADFVRDAAHAVFHFFKHDQGRQTVSVGEFAEALEKVLRGFAPAARAAADAATSPAAPGVGESDLCRLALESGEGRELFFFPRLREELRRHLQDAPRVLRFRGLRGCVKQLVGARRWTPRCRTLEERIVEYLRECLGAEAGKREFSLVVD